MDRRPGPVEDNTQLVIIMQAESCSMELPLIPAHLVMALRVRRDGISGGQRGGTEEKEGNYSAPLTSSTTSDDTGRRFYRTRDTRKLADRGRVGGGRLEDCRECTIFHYYYFHNRPVQRGPP